MSTLQTRPGPAARPYLVKQAFEWAEMIKLEHTVFALPFALSGLILAGKSLPGIEVVIYTVLAFAGARAAAMSLNRLIDAEIDARNPRTMMRAIPTDRISKSAAILASLISFGLMLWSASHLPSICLWLSPIAIAWLALYSYTKRFTWLSHLALGIALGGASLGGWLAAGGSLDNPAAFLLAFAVATWVAGFDIIYACQDIEVDRLQGLCSIPAAFGLSKALLISSCLHVLTIALFLATGVMLNSGVIYWLGIAQAAIMLIYEHSLVKANDLSKVNAAFFNINGGISILMFLSILADRWPH